MAGLQDLLRAHIRDNALPPGTWVMGVGYDDALLAERRHPTRDDLDAVSTEHPIALLHVSLHLATANSAARCICSPNHAYCPDIGPAVATKISARAGARLRAVKTTAASRWVVFLFMIRHSPRPTRRSLSKRYQDLDAASSTWLIRNLISWPFAEMAVLELRPRKPVTVAAAQTQNGCETRKPWG